MGFELLTQPQVFTTRLTAIGGIEGYVPPFIAKFHTWTVVTTSTNTTFNIPQDLVGLTHSPEEAYIVNINKEIIPPTDFTIDYNFRRIIFNQPIPQNTTIRITQIGTIALSTTKYQSLTADNLFAGQTKIEVDSNNPALHVIQNGTGNAIRVDGELEARDVIKISSENEAGNGRENNYIRTVPNGNLQFLSNNLLTDDNIRINIGDTTGYVGIGSEEPIGPLHVSHGSGDIIQKTGSTSPSLIQYLVPSFNTSRTTLEVVDEENTIIQEGGRSHGLDFNRVIPVKPVHYWSLSNPTPTSTYTLAGSNKLTENSANYIVSIGGLVNPFSTYSVNSSTRILTFSNNIPANVEVYVVQHVNPDLIEGYETNLTSVQQITALVSSSQDTVNLNPSWPRTSLRHRYNVTYNGILQIPNSNVYSIEGLGDPTHRLRFEGPLPTTPRLVTISILPSANPTLTNLGEIFEETCFVGTTHNWSFQPANDVATFSLAAGPSLVKDPSTYIVNVGGVLQQPTSYKINVATRQITFKEEVKAGIAVSITQVAHPDYPVEYYTTFSLTDNCLAESNGTAEQVGRFRPGELSIVGAIATKPPIWLEGTTQTYRVPFDASTIVWNPSDNNTTLTLELPKASKYPGRWLNIKRINNTVTSTLSVVPRILNYQYGWANRIGDLNTADYVWAQLQSDGSNWTTVITNQV